MCYQKTQKFTKNFNGKKPIQKDQKGPKNTRNYQKRKEFINKTSHVRKGRKEIILDRKERIKRGSSFDRKKQENRKNLFVSNLSSRVRYADLNKLFGNIGKVRSIVMEKNRDGKPMGVCEVQYEKAKDAAKAIKEYHSAELDGRIVCVGYK